MTYQERIEGPDSHFQPFANPAHIHQTNASEAALASISKKLSAQHQCYQQRSSEKEVEAHLTGAVFSGRALPREGGLQVCQALLGQVQRHLACVARLRSLAQLSLSARDMSLDHCSFSTAHRPGWQCGWKPQDSRLSCGPEHSRYAW